MANKSFAVGINSQPNLGSRSQVSTFWAVTGPDFDELGGFVQKGHLRDRAVLAVLRGHVPATARCRRAGGTANYFVAMKYAK